MMHSIAYTSARSCSPMWITIKIAVAVAVATAIVTMSISYIIRNKVTSKHHTLWVVCREEEEIRIRTTETVSQEQVKDVKPESIRNFEHCIHEIMIMVSGRQKELWWFPLFAATASDLIAVQNSHSLWAVSCHAMKIVTQHMQSIKKINSIRVQWLWYMCHAIDNRFAHTHRCALGKENDAHWMQQKNERTHTPNLLYSVCG